MPCSPDAVVRPGVNQSSGTGVCLRDYVAAYSRAVYYPAQLDQRLLDALNFASARGRDDCD